MSLRALAIMALILVALVAVALIGQRSPSDTSRSDSLFAPGLRTRFDDIESIVVRSAGNEIVATLNQVEDGWVVAERSDYAADTSKIRAALIAIADARIVEGKTSNPELYERLGLDLESEDSRAVSLTLLPESPSTPTMVFGDSEGTSYRYARLEGDPQTFLISADPELPTDTADWLLRQILDVRSDRIERIVVSHVDGEQLEMFKSEVGQNNYEVADIPEGRELQYPGVANVTGNALRDLRFEDVAALDGGAPMAEVTAEFTTFDGLIIRAEGFTIDGESWLRFAARPDTEFADSDGEADAAAEAEAINRIVDGWRYRIASYQYNQLTRRMEDLLRAEDSTN